MQRACWRANLLAGGDPSLADRLERRLLADALDRFVLGTATADATCLPAASAWRIRLRAAPSTDCWQPTPDAVSGRTAYATLLGYSPTRLRADTGLAGFSVEELAMAVELTGDRTYR